MQPVVILYSNKQQLEKFTKLVFKKSFDGEICFFKYKTLDVIVSNKPISIYAENTVLVLLEVGEDFNEMHINSKSICIVDSENKNAIKLLAKNGANGIVCGNSALDTISFSSINDDHIVICQQRAIKTVFGKIIEPREYKFKAKNVDSIPVLLLAAALKSIV